MVREVDTTHVVDLLEVLDGPFKLLLGLALPVEPFVVVDGSIHFHPL